jgi:hypothetical protein
MTHTLKQYATHNITNKMKYMYYTH